MKSMIKAAIATTVSRILVAIHGLIIIVEVWRKPKWIASNYWVIN